MKKIAIATLLAATTMVATAQVSLNGKISEFVDNTKTGAISKTALATDPTSNITISVNENIGGMKARVVLDTSLKANDPITGADTKIGDRQSTIGLSGKLVSMDLGRNLHSHFLAITNNDAFGTLYGSVAGDVHNLRGLRLSNGVFATLSPVKGLTVSYDRTQDGTGTDATSYGINTSLAGVGVTAARFEQGAEVSTVVGLSTKVAGIRLTYTHSDNTGVVKSKGDLIGASRAFGPYTAKASYGKTNTNIKAYSVGVGYALSKRTDLEVAYRNIDKAGTSTDVAQVGAGVIHRF